MRINKFIAQNSSLSRRAADTAIQQGRVTINGAPATTGQEVTETDIVKLDGQRLQGGAATTTIMLNKPVGYVVSRNGQGSKTVYDLLPSDMHNLKPVGRLDKESSGVLLLTNNGQLAQELTHPKFQKTKIYQVTLNRQLDQNDKQKIDQGVKLEDGISHLSVTQNNQAPGAYTITMAEGRNRQIRRTFAALGYQVTSLHRTNFGPFALGNTDGGKFTIV